MAVNFGLLQPAQPVSAFFQGQQDVRQQADQNMLRQMQQAQFQQQQEDRAFQMQQRRLQAEREAQFDKIAGLLEQHGMEPDDPKVLGQFMQEAMKARNPQLASVISGMAERAAKRREVAAVQTRIQTAMGGVQGPPEPAANALATAPAVSPAVNAMLAPPPAQRELLAGTPFAIGMAPPPAAAPVAFPAPAVADNARKIADLERRRDALELGGTPQELALAKQVQRQIDKLTPKEAATPSDISAMKALGFPITPEGWESYQKSKRQPAPVTNVNVSTEKKYGEAFAGNIAKADIDKMTTAEGAPALAESANRIIGLVQQGNLFTGPIADVKLNIARALNVAGVDNAEKIANTERLIAATGQSTLDAIKGAGLGTGQGFTDKDLKFLQGVAGGTINLTSQTLTELASLQHRVATKAADAWNRRRQEIPKDVAQGTGLSMTPITVPPLMQKSAPAAARPKGVGADWTLMTDKNGARAWVSPDRKQHVEVP